MSMPFFMETKANPIIHMETLSKKSKAGKFTVLDFKADYRTKVTKTVWY